MIAKNRMAYEKVINDAPATPTIAPANNKFLFIITSFYFINFILYNAQIN